MTAEKVDEDAKVRQRRSPPTLVHSPSSSSVSDVEVGTPSKDDALKTAQRFNDSGSNSDGNSSLTLKKIASSTTFQKRLSRQSSLSWGHKPSPWIGASCFLFLLPIPLFLRACCPFSAFILGCVTVSSYMSDHVFTGLESWAHTADRVLAPMAFTSCLYSICYYYGLWWAALSLAALKCHVLANYHSKNGNYDQFVKWHSLWHLVGVGTILACFAVNGVVRGTCWEGSKWEEIIHERFMM